eukprot:CAMPEP_0119569740 /NCGR_PEP_ID=MMETSP1352-20130426/42526_1 /TAXON_ID=265584 /ORGANISM="Stauroneis constricta, Strain CCMP1120" /LENGTH=420 /DNA_ID=CAMNT_0007619341 /DNA_START=158 /DNA_END=1420 /DNA_ORIENTATION=-
MRDLSPNGVECQEQPENNSYDTAATSNHDIETFIREIPKIELHVHLDGSFDPKQLWNHLQQNPTLLQCLPEEKKLPWLGDDEGPMKIRSLVASCKTEDEFRNLCVCTRQVNEKSAADKAHPSLERMLECFEVFLPLVNQNYELLEALAYGFVKRQKEQNIVYTEVRYSPHVFAESDPRSAHAAVTRGLRRGCDEFDGIVVNQILCAINFSPQWSMEVVEMANELKNDFPCAVVGVDVAAGEDHFKPNSAMHHGHLKMCQRAKELGLNITIHAGETPGSEEHVYQAIHQYGAKRIGHGYQLVNQPDVLQRIQRDHADVHFEICPTSSVETGAWSESEKWENHPACKLHEAGLQMTVSSDDPAVFDTSLTAQYRIAMKEMGWSRDDVQQSLEQGINAAFLSNDEKVKLRRIIIDGSHSSCDK